MFRELLDAWRNTDPLKDMYAKLLEMLETGQWMFDRCWEAAKQGKVEAAVKEDVYRRDIEVNRAERAIRRRIVEHLTMQPGVDVATCLVLMSVVKDAERIGDYCKNVLEAAELEAAPLTGCAFYDSCARVYNDVRSLFEKTRRALAESDVTLGHEVIEEERGIVACCDTIVERLAADDLPSRKGVPWALVARHLKRIAAHLGNMASGLVMPLHKLDYYDEKWLPGVEDRGD